MEPSGNICPSCKQPLPADTPLGGLCPACLIRSGFYSGTAPEPEKHTKFKAPAVGDLAPHFPQLEILELIGRGGMGAVYKARQPKLNRFVALKILAREGDTDARFADRFQREAQALAHMNHPNIVTVYDFGEAGGHFYLLMEFVDGMNLRQLEQTSKLAPEEALTIVPPICDALQYAHSQGIVHRDIKPENILLDKNGQVKIADFGIAKILGTGTSPEEPLTGDDQRVGTPHYMAPEQVEKPTTVDHRADIYSLGVVFYEMLTGELPLGRFAPPSHKVQIDVRLDEIVLRALDKEPELRYQQASEIRTQVETLSSKAELNSDTTTSALPRSWLTPLLLLGFFIMMLLVYVLVTDAFDQFGFVFFFVILMMTLVAGLNILGEPSLEQHVKSKTLQRDKPAPGPSFGMYAIAVAALVGIALAVGILYYRDGSSRNVAALAKATQAVTRPKGAAPRPQTYSSGVHAELVGVAAHPRNGKIWTGDGRLIPEIPHEYEKMDLSSRKFEDQVAREIYLKFIRLKEDADLHFVTELQGAIGYSGESRYEADMKFYGIGATFLEGQQETKVRVGIASGPWQTVAQGDFSSSGFSSQGGGTGGSYDVKASGLVVADGKPHIILSENMIGKQIVPELVDTNGKVHRSYGSESSESSNLRQSKFFFEAPILSESIKKIVVKTRDYEWREFVGVKLQPVGGIRNNVTAQPGDSTTATETQSRDNSTTYAHQGSTSYQPPDFESFFPDDADGARKLENLWDAADKDSRSDEEILGTVRNGLKRLRVDRRMPVLRWMGNKYIWNKPDQHPLAIEIMYHAAETRRENLDPYNTRGPAIYFGLSVVKDKTPAILRTLVDIAMLVDDPNDLDRIAWGTESQRQEMLKFLEPHIQSNDPATKAKAEVVRRILTGELKAFHWATERAKDKAAADFKDQLPAIKAILTSGTSEERSEALKLIMRERLTLIMDESFIAAFVQAAKDSDPRVRQNVARIVGEHWVWSAKEQNPQALVLMLNLSEDEDRQVRHNAVYFGLSTVRPMLEGVVRRMLEIAIDDREPNNYQRIVWALKNHRELTKQVLHQHFLTNEKTRAAALEIYKDMTGAEPPPASPDPGQTTSTQVSPEAEIILFAPEKDPSSAYFDFDKGVTVVPPDGLTTSSNKVYDWAFASGVDVVADTTGTVPGLVGYSPCILVHMPDSAWDTGTSETVTAAIETYDKTAFKIPHFGVGPQYHARDYTHLTMGSTVPPTYAFRTGEGSTGLLQLLHSSLQQSEPTPLDPQGFVQFRYKRFLPQ